MLDWPQIGKFLDVCAMYFTTQLVRCAACSLALLGIVTPESDICKSNAVGIIFSCSIYREAEAIL